MSGRIARRSRSRSQVSEKSVASSEVLTEDTDSNFYPTVLGLVVFGFFNIAISSVGSAAPFFLGIFGLLFAAFTLQYFLLHGHHFWRSLHVFYDEANILETNDGFECYDGPVLDDQTPGGCCGGPFPVMGPQDSFYVQHYGNMMPNALRFQKEWEEEDRKRKEEKKKAMEKTQSTLGEGGKSDKSNTADSSKKTRKDVRSEKAAKSEKPESTIVL
uniref:Uncharacterized protein n=1 Tax=Steinernema glaseri TaxID=37863 RepID=A0A1I8A461_9BILA